MVVVENASGDASANRIRAWAAESGVSCGEGDSDWLVLLEAADNHGYATGNNIGLGWIADAGEASHVWLLNPDTLASPSALTEMLARMADDPRIGTCGALLCEMDESDVVQCFAGAGFHPRAARPFDLGKGVSSALSVDHAAVEQKLAYVMGACLLASRAFLEAAGPMDERFFFYFEEGSCLAEGIFS